MKSFANSQEVFEWLSGYINFERGLSSKTFRIDRMQILAELANNPERCAPVIHVAGSKGKGSVTTMIADMLHEAGYRTGRYVSPHITEYRERVSRAEGFFDETIYATAGDELRILVKEAVQHYPELFDPTAPEGEEPTFFELLTLYFFLCCRLDHCDVMVVETGMGGRLDATNIVTPLVSVITPIELEHTQYLGTTYAAIAGEKAGIIKVGRPVVLAEQQVEALMVLRTTAADRQAPLWYLPELADIHDIQVTRQGTRFSINIKPQRLPSPLDIITAQDRPSLELSMVGAIQAQNALQALTAVRIAYPDIPMATLFKSLKNTCIPGRFERIHENPDIIIDGAHTPRSVKLCTDTFLHLYGRDNLLLFGCAADKDVETMARTVMPSFSHIIITKPGNFKKSNMERTEKAFTDTKVGFNVIVESIPDTLLAIERATFLTKATKKPLLVTGSFYLAADTRAFCTSI
ncbi:bifunctional folylpolyglutamate synthase/dihydrofolate synthase [Gracilinema caldarium]|uniref:Dihydrofolate synthase/folylpolyglutamate synthase n=1 Tax=Gracilinema caldarium (strain ATCC 51460 / DSM 7334 / H1) TaxID=744872 RepID=F8F0L6_GRAC1|nr:Mur ligase family protein [Gracilinema caldarium]AEJ19723.1 FolC bifunctional protein [Gracilinema caldarium DSM 7334]